MGNKILFILVMGVIAMLSFVSASLYTGQSKTDCEWIPPKIDKAGVVIFKGYDSCVTHLSSNPYYYIIEDERWKPYYDARSLKGQAGYYVEVNMDKKFPVKIIDFNATSIQVDFGITATEIGISIPIKVVDKLGLESYQTSITFNTMSDERRIIPISLEKEVKYGTATTSILLSTNITEDGYIDRAEGGGYYSRINTTSTLGVGQAPLMEAPPSETMRGYIQFNTSMIDSYFNIYGVYFNYSVIGYTSPEGQLLNITHIEREVSSQTNTNLFNDIGNGTTYANDDFTNTGYHNVNLGVSGISDVNKSQDTDWFAVGMKIVNENSNGYNSYVGASESSASPELYIYYFREVIPPILYFKSPTPANATHIYETQGMNLNISIEEINLTKFIFSFNYTNYTVYDDTLKVMYNFENKSELGESSTILKDLASDTLNDGTISGATLVTGVYGNALSFDGINDNVAISTTGLPSGNSPRTIEYWFNTKRFGTSTEYSILTIGTSGAGQVTSFNTEDNAVAVAFYSNRWISPKNNLSTNTWYHVAFVVKNGATTTDSTNWTLYIDGVAQAVTQEAGSVQTLNTGTTAFRLGSSQVDTLFYNGTIDELRIWNRSLTSKEINETRANWLYKYNQTMWNYISSFNNLGDGIYKYYGYAEDYVNLRNSSELRWLYVDNVDLMSGDIIVTPNNPSIPYVYINNQSQLNLTIIPI